jgi:hypothetical protein
VEELSRAKSVLGAAVGPLDWLGDAVVVSDVAKELSGEVFYEQQSGEPRFDASDSLTVELNGFRRV